MNGASGSTSDLSSVQGVCPDGWHVPGDDEWQDHHPDSVDKNCAEGCRSVGDGKQKLTSCCRGKKSDRQAKYQADGDSNMQHYQSSKANRTYWD